MKKIRLALLLFIICFLYFLPSHNKYWHPYDEGFMLEAASMINKGMFPYRDFFILLYPPAQIYVLALLFKIFGAYFAVARFYTILVETLICLLVFYIGKKVTSSKYALLGMILCLIVISSYGRPIAVPTWPAIALSLLSVLFLLNFFEKERMGYLVFSGFFAGLVFIFRHDAGLWTTIPGAAGIWMHAIRKGKYGKSSAAEIAQETVRLLSIYAAFACFFIAALGVWLYKNQALNDALRSLFMFPSEYIAKAAVPFPKFCFNPSMIFHRGSLFIKNNQFYVPILTCAASAILLIIDIVSKKILDKKIISLTVILLLGILYLQQVMIRTDLPHLASAFAPSAILFAAMFTSEAPIKNMLLRTARISIVSVMSLFMALLLYIAAESYLKETFVKAHIKREIEPVHFDRGTLYVPDDGRDAIISLVAFVKDHTKQNEKIYVGNMDHSVREFNQYHVLYFLTGRMSAVKYYELCAGLQSRFNIQEEMIESLKRDKTRFVILRSYGTDESSLGPLDKFIRENYKLSTIIDTAHIYVKK
ncbi:MAG: hypothetical protein A2987_06520 [Omnitrophica bacterium RIFCSPLOWO2_01_FULL_45_10]|nr:MAG: hypothetical protein A2987_06520 [Omnitrophica bacterium RIFCSPLOWO2_01_FULL_45_10]